MPPLTANGIPEGTKYLAIIMDDPDAMGAVGKVWVHWIVWNMDPTIAEIGENLRDILSVAVEGITDFGEMGYGGPAPPDKRHTYVFKLYALDIFTDSDNNPLLRLEHGVSNAHDVKKAIEDHILDQATLTGTYAP